MDFLKNAAKIAEQVQAGKQPGGGSGGYGELLSGFMGGGGDNPKPKPRHDDDDEQYHEERPPHASSHHGCATNRLLLGPHSRKQCTEHILSIPLCCCISCCRSALGIEAGVKAESVFQVGQCVKCRVLRSDPSARRLSLSFITTSSRDNTSEGEADDVKPGKIVAGTVAHVSGSVIILDISTAKGSIKGYLTFPHLSEQPGSC